MSRAPDDRPGTSPQPDAGQPGQVHPRAPDGQFLTGGRRLTYRAARSWLKRTDALLGTWRCGAAVDWVAADGRAAAVAATRRREGGDCNPAGDVLLYRLPDGRPVVVIDES